MDTQVPGHAFVYFLACLHAKAAFEQLHQGPNAAVSSFAPECRDNGEYESHQCDARGLCWCVDENGFEIAGTRVDRKQTVTTEEASCAGKFEFHVITFPDTVSAGCGLLMP